MKRMLVMTVIGQDRPGLVESVAALVAKHQGNWLESRMARLGGQFAGILRAEVPAEQEAGLMGGLQELSRQGLTVVVHPDLPAASAITARFKRLEIVGQDRPGIVRQISHTLAQHGVNVEELETECASAAMTGETLFKARAKVSLPDNCDLETLQRELEQIGEDLIVETSLEEFSQEKD